MRSCGQPFLFVSLSVALMLGASACKQSSSPDTTNNSYGQGAQQYPSQNPASANLAPISNATDNTGSPPSEYQTPQAQQRYAAYSNQPDPYAAPYSSDANYDQNYTDFENPVEYAPDPPPDLPEYQQPPCPGENYIWTPGYWNYDPSQGYYWVPGAWVRAPYVGALWTPGWWSFENGRYAWRRGYWGRHIGYYGGIDYGYGYDGYGYQGGYWHGDRFAYNRVANNVEPSRQQDVYSYRFQPENNTRVSYNGGSGVQIRPRPAEIAAMHEEHNAPLAPQMQLVQDARNNPQNFAKVDRGRPAQPAAAQPLHAENPVNPPQPRNLQAIAPPREEPGQPRNIPPPQAGHYVANVEPQQGGPRVGAQARLISGGAPQNPNEPQSSSAPARRIAPSGIPVHAVGPEPAVPRQRMDYQPKQSQPPRPAPQSRPQQRAQSQRQQPERKPEEKRPQ